eukprot:1050926-Pleurochrysis_carterae.AAC.3
MLLESCGSAFCSRRTKCSGVLCSEPLALGSADDCKSTPAACSTAEGHEAVQARKGRKGVRTLKG